MYSRFPRHSDRPIRLPDHYSGCAFSEADEPPSPPPTPPAETEHPSPCQHQEECTQQSAKGEIASVFGKTLNHFSGGLQFEELLLIGLIILLAHTEQESDVILWLALLLFCK